MNLGAHWIPTHPAAVTVSLSVVYSGKVQEARETRKVSKFHISGKAEMYKIQEDPKISKELTLARGTDAGLLSCLEETGKWSSCLQVLQRAPGLQLPRIVTSTGVDFSVTQLLLSYSCSYK